MVHSISGCTDTYVEIDFIGNPVIVFVWRVRSIMSVSLILERTKRGRERRESKGMSERKNGSRENLQLSHIYTENIIKKFYIK